MYCPECGAEVQAGATFCQECGENVEGESDSQTRQQPESQSATQTAQSRGDHSSPGQSATNTAQTGQRTGGLAHVPIVGGAVAGVGTWLVSFLAVFGLITYELEGAVPGGGEFSSVEFSGFLVYNAHNVKINTPYDSAAFSYLEQLYAGSGGFFTIPKIVYYLLPVVVLVIGGYLVASRTQGLVDGSLQQGAQAGASLAIGYCAVSVLGALTVFSVSGIGARSATLGPQITMSLLLMGVVYPVVLGGLGGLLASWR